MRYLLLALVFLAACGSDQLSGTWVAADQPDAWESCPFYVTTWTELDLHEDGVFEAHSRTHYWAGTWFEVHEGLVALEVGPTNAFQTDDTFLQLGDDGSLSGVVTQHFDGGECAWRVALEAK